MATAANKKFYESRTAKKLNLKNKNDTVNFLIQAGVMTKSGKMKKHICNGGYYDKRD